MFEFQPFSKIARLKRELVITEKLDGINAQVAIFPLDAPDAYWTAEADPYCIAIIPGANADDSPLAVYAGSRNRWLAPEGTAGKGCDNFAFARFVSDNVGELSKLGPGRHYGEWYGKGIQRGYGLEEKRFALFNVARWGSHNPNTPACCEVVPVIRDANNDADVTDPDHAFEILRWTGSQAVPGFMSPEGIVVYHTASHTMYKQTFGNDGGKWANG